jgi:hypothetical protein
VSAGAQDLLDALADEPAADNGGELAQQALYAAGGRRLRIGGRR